MRSVVVVLPASMWAMIPMLRVFSRGNLRAIESGVSRDWFGAKKWAPRAQRKRGCGRGAAVYVVWWSTIRKPGLRESEQVNSQTPEATSQDSRGPSTSRARMSAIELLGIFLAIAAFGGAVLLILSDFMTLFRVHTAA